jgi:hypothetical protein
MVVKIPNMMLWPSKFRRKTLGFDSLTRCMGVNGLSYVEVMVSMLTSALFLSTTLQAYIAATGIKARSQQMNTAIAGIQADVEAIRHRAQVVPKTTADCQLPPSSSYVQQLMSNIKDNDAKLSQNQSPKATIGSILEVDSILKQSSTLSIQGLPNDYTLRRTLSLDTREVPSAQVLQISYQVLRQSSTSSELANELVKIQTEENDDQPRLASTQTETLIAQLHTSILPNAALVCF